MTFDEFIVSCATDSVNAAVPGNHCTHCGAQTFIYEDDGPACLPCSLRTGEYQLAFEHIETGLTDLLRVVRDLRPDEKAKVAELVPMWRVAVELLGYSTGAVAL